MICAGFDKARQRTLELLDEVLTEKSSLLGSPCCLFAVSLLSPSCLCLERCLLAASLLLPASSSCNYNNVSASLSPPFSLFRAVSSFPTGCLRLVSAAPSLSLVAAFSCPSLAAACYLSLSLSLYTSIVASAISVSLSPPLCLLVPAATRPRLCVSSP